MTRDQVERYLDYCSEMLSLVGKTAALCAEESRDSVILETVSTVENLTVGLSRKIWQKISNLPPGRAPNRGVLMTRVAHRGRLCRADYIRNGFRVRRDARQPRGAARRRRPTTSLRSPDAVARRDADSR